MTYDLKKILWENVAALMEQRWGGENLKRLAREAGIGTGTVSRIKDQETSVGTDVVEKIATLFRVPPMVLLMPIDDRRLLTIVEAFRVAPESRIHLFIFAKGILEEHERDAENSSPKRA